MAQELEELSPLENLLYEFILATENEIVYYMEHKRNFTPSERMKFHDLVIARINIQQRILENVEWKGCDK